MFGRIHPWSHQVLDFCFLEILKIAFSISVCVIGLFIFSFFFWFSLGRLNLCKNLSIYCRLSILLASSCSLYSLMILCVSVVSVVISPFSFLIVLIWTLSFFFLRSLAKGLSIFWCFQRTNFCFLWYSLLFVYLYVINFCSNIYDFFPSTTFGLCLFFIL